MSSSSRSNSWDYEYLGRSVKNGFQYDYRLDTISTDNLDAKSPFEFQIFPKSLTVVKRPIIKGEEGEEEESSHYLSPAEYVQKLRQKVAAQTGGVQGGEEGQLQQLQQEIKEITGSVPIRELLGTDEEKLLHVSLQEDPINSFKRFGGDGSTITHTEYVPVPCGRPSCGICNNNLQVQNQKVASSNSSTTSSSGFISSRLDAVAAANKKLAFEEIEDHLFGL